MEGDNIYTDKLIQNKLTVIAEENSLPRHFVAALFYTEVREGIPVPDAMDWLQKEAPAFRGKVV